MANRIIISECSITESGLLITEMKVIDGVSGERLRIVKFTTELIEFLKSVEISVDDYLAILRAKEQNPALTKLIQTFKLYTDEQ